MWLNIPMLPVQIDTQTPLHLRWRWLPPFRLTIWGTMFAVVIVAIFFAAVNHVDRLGKLNQYHTRQIRADTVNRDWHLALSHKYVAAIKEADVWFERATLTILTLLLIGVAGWLLNRIGGSRLEATRRE